MPIPIDIPFEPSSLGILALYAVLTLWEALRHLRSLPKVHGWVPRAFGSFVMYFYLSSYLSTWRDNYLARYPLFDISKLGTWDGAGIGLLVYKGLLYA